jgi:hypothetical protein
MLVIVALLDPEPDPLTRLNPDPIRIRNPAWSGWRKMARPRHCWALSTCPSSSSSDALTVGGGGTYFDESSAANNK